jgi:hypothetical protein
MAYSFSYRKPQPNMAQEASPGYLEKSAGSAAVRIDRARMDNALASDSFEIPDGLTPEEIRQHIIATALAKR